MIFCLTSFDIADETGKCGNCECTATWGRQTSSQSFGLYWAILYCACALTVISQLPIKIMTSTLDSATAISETRAIIVRSDDVFTLWPWPFTLDLERLQYKSGVTWFNSVLWCYVTPWPWPVTFWSWTSVVDGWHVNKNCTKFERNETIRGEVIDDLA